MKNPLKKWRGTERIHGIKHDLKGNISCLPKSGVPGPLFLETWKPLWLPFDLRMVLGITNMRGLGSDCGLIWQASKTFLDAGLICPKSKLGFVFA